MADACWALAPPLRQRFCSRVHLRSVVPKALRRVMSTPPEYDIYSIGEPRRDGPPTLYHPCGMKHAVTFAAASPTC